MSHEPFFTIGGKSRLAFWLAVIAFGTVFQLTVRYKEFPADPRCEESHGWFICRPIER